MGELIKHECGLAFIRLKKPLKYYHKKYGTALYGLLKLQLLMQKQRNRGQDGAGVVSIKLNGKAGHGYIHRRRTNKQDNLKGLFDAIYKNYKGLSKKKLNKPKWLKENIAFAGEVLMGHLRYGTHGSNGISNVHPVIRKNNWKTRTLVLAGNFNLTNVDELFKELVSYGQHPYKKSDTITVLEKIGHFLEREVQAEFDELKRKGIDDNTILSDLISEKLDLQTILKKASKSFDGGYVMGGLVGNGDAFVLRDPNGIRPAYFYEDDEVVVAASERPAIQTAFDVKYEQIKELKRGHALIVKNNGLISEVPIIKQGEKKSCSFERIYFSRGTDKDIYYERKELGSTMAKMVLKSINNDLENTVFSFIPNTANVAFNGLIKGIRKELNKEKRKKILALGNNLNDENLQKILAKNLRIDILVVKDAKLRTFITQDNSRNELVSHVYDVTYGIIKDNVDTVVLIDDSIVRGTTLKESIISILSRLNPKKIIILSSAPQIRYPDCYGIDMSRMNDFIAFRALVELLNETGQNHLMQNTYDRCKAQENLPTKEIVNEVKKLYETFTYDEITKKIAELATPKGIKPEVEVIYQTVENLHEAIPEHLGDWYFTGNYPTPGGNKVVNKSFINFMEGKDDRSY